MSSMYSLIIILTIVFKLVSVTQEREQASPRVSSYYGLPLLFPYGNCSWQLNTQTLELYLTHMLPTKTYANVWQMNTNYKAAPQTNVVEEIDDVAIKTMLETNSEATEYNQCMGYYCYEKTTSNWSNGLQSICNHTYRDQITGIFTEFGPLNDPSTFLFALQKESSFVHVLPQLPTPSMTEALSKRNQSELHNYRYYMIYGNSFQRQDYTVHTITIMATAETNYTQIIVELMANVHVYWNKELLSPAQISSNQFSLKQGDVMWLENTQEVEGQTLSLSKIISSEQLVVYTAVAKATANRSVRSGFSYITSLLHQMPDTRRWGKMFVVDHKHLELLPRNNKIFTSLSILAVNDTKVVVTTYADQLQTSYRELRLGAEGLQSILITYEINTHIHPTHIVIQGTQNLLILYETFTAHKGRNVTHFSFLLQPIEWFTFRQSAILSLPLETHNQSYRIALVSNKQHEIEVHTNKEEPVNIYNYEKFEQVQQINTKDYDLYHIWVRNNARMEGDTMLIFSSKDSNRCSSKMGASLFSFSNSTSYAHSNPYVLDDSILEESSELCKTRFESNLVTVSSTTSATMMLMIILIIVTIVVVISMKPRIFFQKKDPLPQDFKYDIFLSFADEDKVFVKEYLYNPLKCKGYEVFWHLSDFIAGMTIAENMLKAIRDSRWLIFVCSEHFARSDFCQQELKFGLDSHYNKYKGKYRRVIPLVIQKGSCPQTLTQLKPINHTLREGPTPNKRDIHDIIKMLNFGKSLKVLKEERDTKERQKSRQTTKKAEVKWNKNNEDSVLLLSTTSDCV